MENSNHQINSNLENLNSHKIRVFQQYCDSLKRANNNISTLDNFEVSMINRGIVNGMPMRELFSIYVDSRRGYRYKDMLLGVYNVSTQKRKTVIKDGHSFARQVFTDPKNWYFSGKNIFLFGPNGAGKTTLSCIICATLNVVSPDVSTYYISFKDLYNMYNIVTHKRSEYSLSDPVFSAFDEIIYSKFLAIDELGKEVISDAFISFFEWIMKLRGDLLLNTMIVSNIQVKNLKKGECPFRDRYGNSVSNFLLESTEFWVTSQENSFRQDLYDSSTT